MFVHIKGNIDQVILKNPNFSFFPQFSISPISPPIFIFLDFQFSPKFNLNPFQKEKVVQYFNVRCAAQYVTCFLFTD